MADRALSPFAGRLRALLEERGLSYAALGVLVGSFKSTCYRWASDQCIADTQSLLRLSEVLGVSVDFLVHGEDHRPAQDVMIRLPPRQMMPPPRLSVEKIRPQRLRQFHWHGP